MRVLLDTNFLLLPFSNHIDIFEEIQSLLAAKVEFLVLANSLRELRSMKGREKPYANAMLGYIANQGGKFEILQLKGKTDEAIKEFAEKNKSEDFFVATMDKALRDALKKARVRVIILRGKGHLEQF
ncbi:MAG: hypothetical protein V1835_03680 [Candidatus Micrarchaeota archaeon]